MVKTQVGIKYSGSSVPEEKAKDQRGERREKTQSTQREPKERGEKRLGQSTEETASCGPFGPSEAGRVVPEPGGKRI